MPFTRASRDRVFDRHNAASDLVRTLRQDDIRAQFVWYLVVGAASLSADLVVFAALLDTGSPVLLALVVGFVVGTLANDVLSRTLAFTGGRFRRRDEILRLFAVSLVGLALTAFLVAACVRLGLSAIAAKLVATPIAFFWNYFGRRTFVFHSDMPLGTWRLSRQAIERARARIAAKNRHV